ncbi:MAG: FAD/NAD(P)-binding protein [Acidobacteriota bacterium]|nr:FAD/NAD(P)-binding protein [Acidobacteriota bacterium]
MDSAFEYKNLNSIGTLEPSKSVEDKHFIAIIGGGPKGLYALERLTAELAKSPANKQIEIHIFNKTSNFGSGEIYAPNQPDYLMINFCIGNINMWIDEAPESVSPETLSLTDWLRQKLLGKVEVSELDYAPRGVVGQYLEEGFKSILGNLPTNISVIKVVAEVLDIEQFEEEFSLTINQNGFHKNLETKYQDILLTTGHSSRNQSETEIKYRRFSDNFLETSFIPFVYPIENLGHIPAQNSVAIKGMGLTFIDTVLALTAERGGNFERNKSGEIVKYISSGKEPKAIYPFSRSGVPILPRGAFCGEPNFTLQYFTEEKVAEIKQNRKNGRLDFERDLWTLIEQEMIYAYYRILMKNKDFDSKESSEFSEFATEISRFHETYLDEKRFELKRFLNPLLKVDYQPKAHKEFVENYIEQAISEAKSGEDKSPFMAIAAVWREITPIFGKIYEFGGLTGESHEDFLKNYFGMLCRITFGPPIDSIEKILAIGKAGILKFEIGANAEVFCDEASGKFHIKSLQNGFETEVEHLIDARIPKKKIPDSASELYKNLYEKGLIQTFKNGSFDVGCVDISRSGEVCNSNGEIVENLRVYGTPTEGITFDNDSLSRQRNNFASIWAKNTAKKISVEK